MKEKPIDCNCNCCDRWGTYSNELHFAYEALKKQLREYEHETETINEMRKERDEARAERDRYCKQSENYSEDLLCAEQRSAKLVEALREIAQEFTQQQEYDYGYKPIFRQEIAAKALAEYDSQASAVWTNPAEGMVQARELGEELRKLDNPTECKHEWQRRRDGRWCSKCEKIEFGDFTIKSGDKE